MNTYVAEKPIPGDVFYVSFQSYFFVEITQEQGAEIMNAYYSGARIESGVTTYEDFLSRNNGPV